MHGVFVDDALSIQPMWVIDEYDIIFFSDVCLSPIIPPIRAFSDEVIAVVK